MTEQVVAKEENRGEDREINMPRCFKGFQRQKSRGQMNSSQVAQTSAQAKESILEYKRKLTKPENVFKRSSGRKIVAESDASIDETRMLPSNLQR